MPTTKSAVSWRSAAQLAESAEPPGQAGSMEVGKLLQLTALVEKLNNLYGRGVTDPQDDTRAWSLFPLKHRDARLRRRAAVAAELDVAVEFSLSVTTRRLVAAVKEWQCTFPPLPAPHAPPPPQSEPSSAPGAGTTPTAGAMA